MDQNSAENRDEVFSKKIKAGKRTYFFDVKATRANDYYITITESKRRQDGFGYEKHKIFLYKEDFNKFMDGMNDTVNHIKTNLLPDHDFEKYDHEPEPDHDGQDFASEFDEIGKFGAMKDREE